MENLKHIQQIKKLVATKGRELENCFEDLLKDLNLAYEKAPSADFILQTKPPIVIEITGTEGNLQKRKIAQTFGHYLELKEQYGEDIKMCLIIITKWKDIQRKETN